MIFDLGGVVGSPLEAIAAYERNQGLPRDAIGLQATRDIRKVALWLGHATLKSTEIYLRADPTEKLNIIEGRRRGAI